MGFYSRVIFPHLCDLALDRPAVAVHRRQLLQRAQGKVLEIGFGTGLNLPFYPEHVHELVVVDPNPGMHRKAQQRMEQSQIEVEQRQLNGEELPFDDGAFDCVVSTFTLCSIEHVDQAMAEIHRVLAPCGRFLFLEHGLSPDPRIQKWQRRLNWLQRRVAGNCRLDRDIRALVAAQAFGSVEMEEFELEGAPKIGSHLYRGEAIKTVPR